MTAALLTAAVAIIWISTAVVAWSLGERAGYHAGHLDASRACAEDHARNGRVRA